MSYPMTAKTPAGQRLEGWCGAKSFFPIGLDFDEAAQAVLNVENADNDSTAAMVAALKAELNMFTASDEQWERVSNSIITRLEVLGVFLVQSESQEGGT